MRVDLLAMSSDGGCSAKLSPGQLAEALAGLPVPNDPNLLVDISTHDDAGVYKLTDELAIVQTTDFFPPVCSDPFEFGQIAAANALSDVFAMGGRPITALNLVMFPATEWPLSVLKSMLAGGMSTVGEAGAVIVGGHTIDDTPIKYGLAVTGVVHPKRIITNAAARPGQNLILCKPIGTGITLAGHRIGAATAENHRRALDTMKQLNMAAAGIMQRHGVRCATDITGFGLLGHAAKMAEASSVTLRIQASAVPLLPGAYELADMGCIPGAAFRNCDFAETRCAFPPGLDYNRKMLMLDAQTSGGMLMAVPDEETDGTLRDLRSDGYPFSCVIGTVAAAGPRPIEII